MKSEQMMSNLKFVAYGDNFDRIKVIETPQDGIRLDVDIHGLTRWQGHRLIKNTININTGIEFQMNIIHGFNHGTVLKEMIMEEEWSTRVVEQWSPQWNPGQTYMTILR